MKLRDHRNQAKQWSYGRAQLAPASAGAHFGKRRTKLTTRRVKAAAADKDQTKRSER